MGFGVCVYPHVSHEGEQNTVNYFNFLKLGNRIAGGQSARDTCSVSLKRTRIALRAHLSSEMNSNPFQMDLYWQMAL